MRDRDAPARPATREWESHAGWWRRNFTDGADPVYADQILPSAVAALAGCVRVLDVGCGDGQLGRALRQGGGGQVWVGVDASAALCRAGREADPSAAVVCGRAERLPFAPGAFDAAVVVLVLEHVADLRGALHELARVVRAGGRLVLFLNHPLFQAPGSGWVEDHVLGEAYWRVGPYLAESAAAEEVDAGVWLTFHHRTLSTYLNAVVAAGFELRHVAEPAPPPRYLQIDPALTASGRIPRLLVMEARRRQAPGAGLPPEIERVTHSVP